MRSGVSLAALVVLSFLAFGATAPATSPTIEPATQPGSYAASLPALVGQPALVRGGNAVVIELQGQIDDFNRDKLFRRFDEARQLGAKTIILDVDTYGGLVTAGLEISHFLKRQDDLHTIAFVKDKAISAGAMIAMACDEIVVSSSATIGDCAPIVFTSGGDLESLPAAERAKQESPILADFEESAHRNHHDVSLAQAMVDVRRVVYWVQSPAGERRFVNADGYKALIAEGWKDVPGAKVPVDSDQTLLTVTSEEAIDYGLATEKYPSAQALATARSYTVLATIQTSAGEKFVEILSSTVVRGILLVIFLQCLYIVLHAPGHGVAETLGLLALGLMLGVPLLTGYATWWEILMIFIGLGLVAVEIIIPGHILPGLTGALLVLVGLVLTFVPKEPTGIPGFLPSMHSTYVALERGLFVVVGGMACSMFLWLWLNRFLPKMPYFNRLIITATSGGPAPVAQVIDPLSRPTWPLIGSVGRAISELKPGGSAEFFDDSIADSRMTAVVSDSGFVAPGTRVVVREVAGNRVVVRASST